MIFFNNLTLNFNLQKHTVKSPNKHRWKCFSRANEAQRIVSFRHLYSVVLNYRSLVCFFLLSSNFLHMSSYLFSYFQCTVFYAINLVTLFGSCRSLNRNNLTILSKDSFKGLTQITRM